MKLMTEEQRINILNGLHLSKLKGLTMTEEEKTKEMIRRGFLNEDGSLKKIYGGIK